MNVGGNSIKILQWNVLGKNLCSQDPERGFKYAEIDALRWTNRKELMKQKLDKHNADIVCLEECHPFKFYKEYFISKGYNFFFKSKGTFKDDWPIDLKDGLQLEGQYKGD